MTDAVMTKRDGRAIELVDKFGMMSLRQLAASTYAGKDLMHPLKSAEDTARRRLRILYKHHLISRIRINGQNSEFVYFTDRRPPVRAEHHLMLADLYIGILKLGAQIESFEREPNWGDLVPDAYTVFWYNGRKLHAAIEIHTGSHIFDQKKYENDAAAQKRLAVKRYPSYPRVLVVAGKPVSLQPSTINFIVVPTSLEGLGDILK